MRRKITMTVAVVALVVVGACGTARPVLVRQAGEVTDEASTTTSDPPPEPTSTTAPATTIPPTTTARPLLIVAPSTTAPAELPSTTPTSVPVSGQNLPVGVRCPPEGGKGCGLGPEMAGGYREPVTRYCLITDPYTAADRGDTPAAECMDPITHTVPADQWPTP